MSEILISSRDQGSTFEATQDDVIVIHLEENITTGYRWEVEITDSSLYELLDTDYLSTPEAGIGSGGIRTLRFRAKSSGSGRIQLRLRRSWDPVDVAVESFEVDIRVQ